MKSNQSKIVPQHVAFIMDGNGRWAKERGLSRKFGHIEGVKTLMNILDFTFKSKVKYVSVYAFSTENWNRPKDEVDALVELIRRYFRTEFKKLLKKRIKVVIWGDKSVFDEDIKNIFAEIENYKIKDPVGYFNVALNYGGRNEIVSAVNAAIERSEKVTEESFKDLLYSTTCPDPDLIIRTGGEMRLSNFLLYQCAYSELYFTQTLWPDFSSKELSEIFDDFSNRDRRFGRVK